MCGRPVAERKGSKRLRHIDPSVWANMSASQCEHAELEMGAKRSILRRDIEKAEAEAEALRGNVAVEYAIHTGNQSIVIPSVDQFIINLRQNGADHKADDTTKIPDVLGSGTPLRCAPRSCQRKPALRLVEALSGGDCNECSTCSCSPQDPIPFGKCSFVDKNGDMCFKPCAKGFYHSIRHTGSCKCLQHFRNKTGCDDSSDLDGVKDRTLESRADKSLVVKGSGGVTY